MNKLVALLRVKDGILFIDQWLARMDALVDEIVVVDNGSTDGTFEKIQQHPKVVSIKQTVGFDEGRDKILLYELARVRNPDWCVWVDVDEIFENRITRVDLNRMMQSNKYTKYKFRRFHFHKDYKHFEARLDKLLEQSIPSRTLWKEQPSGYFLNKIIHNGDIQGIKGKQKISKYRIKHIGAVNEEYLKRKTNIYLNVDTNEQRKKLYTINMKQRLPVWRWHEYNEAPSIVNFQLLMLHIMMIPAKVYFKLKRKIKK